MTTLTRRLQNLGSRLDEISEFVTENPDHEETLSEAITDLEAKVQEVEEAAEEAGEEDEDEDEVEEDEDDAA